MLTFIAYKAYLNYKIFFMHDKNVCNISQQNNFSSSTYFNQGHMIIDCYFLEETISHSIHA